MSGSVLAHVISATPPHEKTTQWSRRVYQEMVRTYKDLLLTNLAFFYGLLRTFYYDAEELNEEHAESTQTLRELHTHGVYTVDGQGNACDPTYRERSYILAAFPKVMVTALLEQVSALGDKVKYVVKPTQGGSVVATNFTPADLNDPYFPRHRPNPQMMFGFVLTQSKYPWSQDVWINDTMVFADRLGNSLPAYEDAKRQGLKRVAQLLEEQTLTIELVITDFCSPLVADEVLLECVKNAGFQPLLVDPFGMTPKSLTGGYCIHAVYGMK